MLHPRQFSAFMLTKSSVCLVMDLQTPRELYLENGRSLSLWPFLAFLYICAIKYKTGQFSMTLRGHAQIKILTTDSVF